MTVGQVAARAPELLNLPIGGAAVVAPSQLRQARRLYCGNLPHNTSGDRVVDFFNEAMLASHKTGVNGNPPVTGINMNYDKGFAFLEFEHSKICDECMALDGILLHGNTLKLRRPKDFLPLPDSFIEEPQLGPERGGDSLATRVISTFVPDSQYKLFAGSIPSHLSEEQVRELFLSFGQLKGFNMVRDDRKGCYAFFEYVDSKVTDSAVSGLHGMKIGDKALLVQKSGSGNESRDTNAPPTSSEPPKNTQAAACLDLSEALVNLIPVTN